MVWPRSQVGLNEQIGQYLLSVNQVATVACLANILWSLATVILPWTVPFSTACLVNPSAISLTEILT
jgi:hypothetical protein